MQGKERFVFPILATAIIVFVASAAVTGYFAMPFVRRVTLRVVALIEGKDV